MYQYALNCLSKYLKVYWFEKNVSPVHEILLTWHGFLSGLIWQVLTICNLTIDKYTNKQHLTPLPLSLPFLFWPDLSAGWCWSCLHRCLTTFKSTSTTWRLCREPHKRCKYLWTSSYIFQWNVFCLHVIKHAHYCDSKRCHLFVSDVRKERVVG